jgi:hypothetical protein
MNLITDPLRSLLQRKLWPVALLLVGALVAVPVVLSKSPTVEPTASPNAKPTEAIPATFVAAVEATEETQRRRVLGDVKDPFEPAPLQKRKKKAKASSEKADESKAKTEESKAKDDEPKTGGTGGGSTGGGVPPVAPAPTPTATVPQYSIKVRFGAVAESGELESKTVERLTVLPNEEAPVLVYSGVENGGKVAVFELTGVVDAQGDGRCVPTPEDCQYLKLRAGETEFITVTETGTEADAQYQLDLVKIYKKATKVSKESLESDAQPLSKAASLRIDGKRDRYVYDDKTGTLKRKK